MESEVLKPSRVRIGELRLTPAPAEQDVKCRIHHGRLLLAALTSAGLLWLAYFPAACGWLGWVALVPLLCLVRTEASTRRVGLYALLAGLLFYWPALQWIRLADFRMYA